MARKVYYSKPLKYFWHVYGTQKQLTPNFTDDEIFAVFRQNLLTKPMGVGESKELRGLIISGWELWRADLQAELLHIFFLDKQLRDFLEKTPLSDLGGIVKFLYENGQSKEVFHTYSKEKSNIVVYRYGLHLPYESDGYAFSLSLKEDGSVELYFSKGENGGLMSDKFYADLIKKDDEYSLTILKMFRLAINTIAYMNCFPDCVADGVPKDLFERSEDMAVRNVTFQVSEKITANNSHLSRIPHFRKGHFRVFKSDYFTNKKGQMVFVDGTMVKGNAKTVAMTTEIDKFSNDAAG